MVNKIWINLPVKNIEKSKTFFSSLGFSFDSKYGNGPHSAAMTVGEKNVMVMMFSEEVFKGFIRTEIADVTKGNEVLFSFDAQSREEVDAMASKVEAAGGIIFSKPQESQGWMYGFGFSDLDGHRWNMLYMDISKLPQK